MAKGRKTGGRDWQKGQSGNPGGRHHLPSDVKEAQHLTRVEFIRIINKHLHSTPAELIAVMQNPHTPAVHLMVISLVMASIDKADPLRAEFILRRVLGDPPKVVESAEPEEANPELVPAMTKEQALELLKKKKEGKQE